MTVPIRTLDEMFETLPACDLLKLDVEGREVGDPNSVRFGYSSGDLKGLLQNHGFTVYAINGTQMSPVDDTSMTDRVGDWVATRDAKQLMNRLGDTRLNHLQTD